MLSIGIGLGAYSVAFAAPYTPIVGFPGLSGNTLTTQDYIKALYMLSITVAGLLAFVKITFAGVKYMLTDVVTSKSDAIKDIRGALIGLLIVLAAVLILNTINPQLTNLNFLGNAPALAPVQQPQQQTTQSTNSACITPDSCNASESFVALSTTCGQCVPKSLTSDNPTAQSQIFQYQTVAPDPTTGIYRIDTATLNKLDMNQVLTQFETACVRAGLTSGQPHSYQDPTNAQSTIYSCQ